MRNQLMFALLLVLLVVSGPAMAQQTQQPRNLPIPGAPEEPTVRFGVDAGFSLPLGDYSDFTGPAIGALGRFEYPVALNATFTLRTGYLHGLKTTTGSGDFAFETSLSYVPILAGFKFFPGHAPLQQGGFYLGGEAGPTMIISRVSGSNLASDSDSEFRFSLGLGAGYEVSMLDLRGGLFVPDIGEFGDSFGLLFTAGITF